MVRILSVSLVVLLAFTACSRKSPAETAQGQKASVTYGSPSKRERTIFGALVPYGQRWRTGANEATVIRLKEDATVGGKPLPKGDYTLWTVPGETEWQVIFNKQVGQWGTEFDPAQDVLTATVAPTPTPAVVEKMTFTFETLPGGEALVLAWDQTQVRLPILYGPQPTAAEPAPADSTTTTPN
ncbi:MAG: DUF2911 domain-containing protein [Bacteroidia bacterium]|nr:DUF2911 domain-containing protein [Bacteroidia bacterium]